MITEEEAKTKWCPHVRQVVDLRNRTSAWNRAYGEPLETCLGSLCMAWRWEGVAEGSYKRASTTRGYCGLSGKPEA